MDRHQFDTEDREGLVAELTEQRVRGWVRLLLAGDKRATSDLHNLVLDRLAEEDAKALLIQAASEPAAAGATFTALVVKVMRDQCEADAEKAVDAMEQDRAESHTDNRIAQAALARAMH
jgi:hypothetical protein